MKVFAKSLFLLAGLAPAIAQAQTTTLTTKFQHVVVIFQENRTPDNLFQGLCTSPGLCSTTPTTSQYNIQTKNWLDKSHAGGVIQPGTVMLDNAYDLSHRHDAFVAQCDLDTATGNCTMDGAAGVHCSGTCPTNPQFKFVDNSTGILDPYLALAKQYGWANYMFQTNQGPSFPAHQFIFGATSAPNLHDDRIGTFAAENMSVQGMGAGCIAQPGVTVQLIDAAGVEDPNNKIFPCFDHDTVADLLKPLSIHWRYYAPSAGSIWTAPNAIRHICDPINGQCQGADWQSSVDLTPADVLRHASSPNCDLRPVSWVIPKGQNSDHANGNTGGGPSWVASIVNTIGTSTCKNPDGTSYWESTAIFITWDDWGGWYDHEPPTILGSPQGGYQLGFRVPLIVVSAFTPAGNINNNRHDFGSIIRFIEQNFGIAEGALTFADQRAKNDLTGFFTLSTARPFKPIPSALDAAFFLNDTTPATDPDEDN
ncbi:MAG TPA: alkaline phosphatase family protein [Candidatus Angelobacter sp.]|nr:alkaline phosphatase family protein [Candidatus Angelobacter sp.]